MEQRSLTALREELKELHELRRRGSLRQWTVSAGYAAIGLGGGLLATWALGTATLWLAITVGIVAFALLMAWPAAIQRQLDMVFYGARPRLDADYVKSRIEVLEFELLTRRRTDTEGL